MATSRQVSASEIAKLASNAAVLASKSAALVKWMDKALSSTTRSALAATANTVLDSTPDNASHFAGSPYTFTVAANVMDGASSILSDVASALSKLSGNTGHTSAFTSASLAVAEALQSVSMMAKALRKAILACCEAVTTVSKGSDPNSAIAAVSVATLALEDVAYDIPKVILATNQAQALVSILSKKITGHDIPASRSLVTPRGAVTVVGGASESIAAAKKSIVALHESISAAKGSIAAAFGSIPPAISAISDLAKADTCLEEIDRLLVPVVGGRPSRHDTGGESGGERSLACASGGGEVHDT